MVEGSAVTAQGFKKFAEFLAESPKISKGTKIAIVVSKDESFSRAKEFERLTSDLVTIVVFNEMHKAKVWLGV